MRQKHLRNATNAAACIILLVMSVISFNCIESPTQYVGPTYDIPLNIPVLNRTDYFGDFTQRDTTVLKFNGSDSTYTYKTTFTTEPILIDTMTYQPEASDTIVALGVFDINAFSLPVKSIPASDFGIPTGDLPGGFPAGTFSAGSIQFVDSSQFDYVAINNGTLTLTVTNNLPIPISFPEPIILRNNWSSPDDTIRVASFAVPGILDQGHSISISSPIDNKLVRGMLTTDAIMLHTDGSSASITINALDGISLSFQSSLLKADSAFATISGQMLHPINNDIFTLDDRTVIRDAIFKAGSFSIVLTNNTKITAQFYITINELFDKGTNNVFKRDRRIQGGESYTYPISMSTIEIKTSGNGLGTYLHYTVDVEVFDSQGEKKAVSKNDVVRAELRPDKNLVAERVNGRFEPMTQSINSGSKSEFDLGKDINKVKAELYFKNMTLKLHLQMLIPGSQIPFSYQNLTLIAKNSKYNQSDSLAISDRSVDPAQPNASIDISNEPKIKDFRDFFGKHFPDLPDSFFVRGTITAPTMDAFTSGNFYTIYDTTSVYPSLELSIPTDLAILNGSLVDVEKNPLDDVDKSVIRSIIYGTMNFEFTNRIPIALSFQMSFLKWDSIRAHNDTTFRVSPSSNSIKPSFVNSNGTAINPDTSNISVFLTGPDISTMAQADSVCIKFYFNAGNQSNYVKFRKDDYIHIRSSVSARCTINKP